MFKAVIQSLTRNDLTDLQWFVYLTADEMQQFPTDITEFLTECTYSETNCDMERDFTRTYNRRYGNCYTYNSGLNKNREKTL